MISAIGIMIGCYILTKMFSMLLEKDDRHSSSFPRALAVVTILITALCMLTLFVGSGPTPPR